MGYTVTEELKIQENELTKTHKLTVIKGGGTNNRPPANCRFFCAYATDTRLMGVVAMSIHWKCSDPAGPEDFHQFFYFDAEEYGLETYRSLPGDDETELELIEQALIGGLGGIKADINEAEAAYLLQSFAKASRELHVTLPEPKDEYAFLLERKVKLSEKEKENLMAKICTPLLTDYQRIHYFLMRAFTRDQSGADCINSVKTNLDDIAESKPATLCKNTIEEYLDEQGRHSYLCEALIEIDGRYLLVVVEITLSRGKVSQALRRTSFRVTTAEAALMLNRPEYITLYEILADPEEFEEYFIPVTKGSMMTAHENGRLFLVFNKNNNHVIRRIFQLNEDIHGLYYVTDFGQLLIASYSLSDIRAMEKQLQKTSVQQYLLPTAKYEFKEPILYEFIQSGFDDFADFLDSIK